MEMLRRQFGIAEPVRRGMELKIASAGEWRPAALGGSSGVHKDILEGRDCEIGWEDVYTGMSGIRSWAPLRRHDPKHIESTNITAHRLRAPPAPRLPHRDRIQDEDELVEKSWLPWCKICEAAWTVLRACITCARPWLGLSRGHIIRTTDICTALV